MSEEVKNLEAIAARVNALRKQFGSELEDEFLHDLAKSQLRVEARTATEKAAAAKPVILASITEPVTKGPTISLQKQRMTPGEITSALADVTPPTGKGLHISQASNRTFAGVTIEPVANRDAIQRARFTPTELASELHYTPATDEAVNILSKGNAVLRGVAVEPVSARTPPISANAEIGKVSTISEEAVAAADRKLAGVDLTYDQTPRGAWSKLADSKNKAKAPTNSRSS